MPIDLKQTKIKNLKTPETEKKMGRRKSQISRKSYKTQMSNTRYLYDTRISKNITQYLKNNKNHTQGLKV